MHGRILNVRLVGAADECAWRDLARRAVEPNPMYEPDCVIPAARHQSFGAEIELLVAEEEGRLYGCLPIRHVTRWHKLPYRIVTTQVRRMIYLGTPLMDAARGVEAATVMLDALVDGRRAGGSRVFALQELNEDGPVAGFFQAAAAELRLPLYAFESFERGFLRRRDEPSYDRLHSKRYRHEDRKRHRRLGEALGGEVTVVDRGADPRAIDDYIALEASGYKFDIGVAMTTVAGEPEYFREMCERFAAQGRLHLVSLVANGRTIAMDVWLRGGEGMFQIKASYDEDYARYSPGQQLHFRAQALFHENTDAAWIDTCTFPDNELLMRLYPDRRRITSFFIVLGRNWRDRATMRSFIALRPVHRRLYDLRHRRRSPRTPRATEAPESESAVR